MFYINPADNFCSIVITETVRKYLYYSKVLSKFFTTFFDHGIET